MNTYKITFQIPVNVYDGSFWLYEREETLDFIPAVGHSFLGIWIPSIFPPGSSARNIARQVTTDMDTGQHLVRLQGFRDGSRSAEEVDANMQGWKRHPTPLRGAADLPIAGE